MIEVEDGCLAPAFRIEARANGLSTVFSRSVPTPMAGSTIIIPGERVHSIDVPVTTMMKCISQWHRPGRTAGGVEELQTQGCAGWMNSAGKCPSYTKVQWQPRDGSTSVHADHVAGRSPAIIAGEDSPSAR